MGPQTDLDRFTADELCQMHADAGRRAVQHFTNMERLIGFMSRMDANDPEYTSIGRTVQLCHEAGVEAHELYLHIAAVANARRANADA